MYHVPVSTGAVIFTKETGYTPGADLVPEGTTKPGTTMTFANQTLTVQTVATIAKSSLQSLNDTPMLMNWIDARLSYAVLLRQEQYLLNDATNGLLVLAPAMAAAPAGSTGLDAIALAIGHLTALGFSPDGIVLNPANVVNMRLLKDSQGRYLWSSPDGRLGTNAMWTLPVVESPSMPLGSFLVGAFSESTILFDRQILIVEISYENEDDFIHNLACFRAEMRFALGVPLVNGLAKGTLPAGSLTAQEVTSPAHHGKK
jgi:HK97 family phage major capsid protein